MRVSRFLALLGILASLAGCACLPGGGTAQSALNALEEPPSTFTPRDQIPTRRF